MHIQQKKSKGSYPGLPVFLLIAAFLLLSNCPLRRAVLNLAQHNYGTEHANEGHAKKLSPIACPGIIPASAPGLTEPELRTHIPALFAIALPAFYLAGPFAIPESWFVLSREALPPGPVPRYVRYRSLLI